MTIIAGYKREDICIYIFDSMLTVKEPNKQMDASFKFIAMEEKIGLFLSGDVNLWKKVIDGIENKLGGVNIKNILEIEGPFRTEINKVVGESPNSNYEYSRALGFIRDEENKANLNFLLELVPGRGCLITEIPDGEFKVIGSGAYIPDIEVILKEIFDKLYHKYKEHLDLYYFASECREKMEQIIQACGPSVYKILGISTVLSIGYIAGDYFKIIGEEREGGHFTKIKGNRHRFSVIKNKGKVQYLDHINENKGYYLNNIFDTIPESSGDIFDPRFSLNFENPLEHYSENSTVYWLNQWVEEEEQFLWRTIDRVEFREYNIRNEKVVIPHPKRSRIFSEKKEKVGIIKIFHYQNIDELYFSVPINQKEIFEDKLSINMFNHNWLSKYIPQYNRIYINHSYWKKCKLMIWLYWSKIKRNLNK